MIQEYVDLGGGGFQSFFDFRKPVKVREIIPVYGKGVKVGVINPYGIFRGKYICINSDEIVIGCFYGAEWEYWMFAVYAKFIGIIF